MNVEEKLRQLELEFVRLRIEQATLESHLIAKGVTTGADLIQAHRLGYLEAVKARAVLRSEIPEMFR
jgi:hypothetical protein